MIAICGPCFDRLELKNDGGWRQSATVEGTHCPVCSRAFPHLPNGDLNVDLVSSLRLIEQLALLVRQLESRIEVARHH